MGTANDAFQAMVLRKGPDGFTSNLEELTFADLPEEDTLLDMISAKVIPLASLKTSAEEMLAGKLSGRIVIDVNARSNEETPIPLSARY
ncbi:hypothetical protein QFZ86_003548 [Pseudomonas plecoglossicida]